MNAFYATVVNAPGLRRFAELYEVVTTDTGCRFTWTVLIEPVAPAVTRFAEPVFRPVRFVK